MCGRYIQVTKVKQVEKRFGVNASPELIANHVAHVNIGPGFRALVIADDSPRDLAQMTFGFTPAWAQKRMYIFNARAEGDKNKENDPNYTGAMEIIKKPMFRQSIRNRRCLVIADAFLEGPEKEKLSKPHVVYLRRKQRPFAFAGIWDEWVDKSSGEVHRGFAIITTRSNAVTQAIGHHRSPVILAPEQESTWLNRQTELASVLNCLHPYPALEMNAYPIAADIKHPAAQGQHLIEPIGERLFEESDIVVSDEIQLFGMGMTTGRRLRKDGMENPDEKEL